MAKKIITDLHLIGSITDGLNFPSDNGIQSYRATALQLKNYIYPDDRLTPFSKVTGQIPFSRIDGQVPDGRFGPLAITQSVTFTKASNNILSTGIVSLLGLEVGDVVRFSGSASNDKIFCIDVITDDNNIIVNEYHANGAGSLSLSSETASATISRVAKWYNAPSWLGRAWLNVKPLRAVATTYTVSSQKSVDFFISLGSTSSSYPIVTINGASYTLNVASSSTAGTNNLSINLSNGDTIKIDLQGGFFSSVTWLERR